MNLNKSVLTGPQSTSPGHHTDPLGLGRSMHFENPVALTSSPEVAMSPSSSQSAIVQASHHELLDAESEVEAEAEKQTVVEIDTLGGESPQLDGDAEGMGPNLDVLATFKDKNELDKSYYMRTGPQAKKFFVRGRVFGIVWHENAGAANESPVTRKLDKPFHTYTMTENNVCIFSHIRRFVIVKERQGYCWAIPINSYGGRGVNKNMSNDEKRAHAIVYARGLQPRRMQGEDEFSKKPIAVNMTGKETLTLSSRLHFDKPQSIDWNIRVKDIGIIQRDTLDMQRLITYFQAEFNR